MLKRLLAGGGAMSSIVCGTELFVLGLSGFIRLQISLATAHAFKWPSEGLRILRAAHVFLDQGSNQDGRLIRHMELVK